MGDLPAPLVLPYLYWEAMLAHVRAAQPNEGCGLLAGRRGLPVRWYPCTNVHPQPRTRYRLDDRELFAALREMDEQGWDLLAIFHSHPNTAAYPSQTDLENAYYPEALYLICSLADPAQPVLRGFWLDRERRTIREHPVEIRQPSDGR